MQVTIAKALGRLLRAAVLAGAGCGTSQGPPPFPPPVAHYVTPSGSGSGDGTAARPWDLVTGLAGASGQVQPGDTVWLRAGTYPACSRARSPAPRPPRSSCANIRASE